MEQQFDDDLYAQSMSVLDQMEKDYNVLPLTTKISWWLNDAKNKIRFAFYRYHRVQVPPEQAQPDEPDDD